VKRAYKFRLRPTRKQEAALTACLEDTRQLYDAALEERREAWRMGCHQVRLTPPEKPAPYQGVEEPLGSWSKGRMQSKVVAGGVRVPGGPPGLQNQ
jgi:putative transposase